MLQLRSVFTLMFQAHNLMEVVYDRAQVLTGVKLVVVVFAMEVASYRFTLVVGTLLLRVAPYISAHTLYLHTCPNTCSSITFSYWDYYTIRN